MATTPPRLPHDTTRPPACSWRGLLIDSARTFWPLPAMELLITIMARYRFNVLHWHLTDNAGWRMRVPGYPMLTAVGGNIPRQPLDWYDTECAPGRKGSWRLTPAHSSQGFYSDANIRHLVNFAAARDIRIVPEISIPSHAGAAIRAYPHLGNPDLVKEATHRDNQTLWPSASSLSFIEAAFHHACTLFPSPTIHIGAASTDWTPLGVRLLSHALWPHIRRSNRTPLHRPRTAHPPLSRQARGCLGHDHEGLPLTPSRNHPPRPPSRGRRTPGRRIFRSTVGPGRRRHPLPQPPGPRQRLPRAIPRPLRAPHQGASRGETQRSRGRGMVIADHHPRPPLLPSPSQAPRRRRSSVARGGLPLMEQAGTSRRARDGTPATHSPLLEPTAAIVKGRAPESNARPRAP